MNMFEKFLATLPVDTLGWTLLHSVWQSLLALCIVWLIFRLMPAQQARARYAVALSGLLMTAIMSVATFILLLPPSPPPAGTPNGFIMHHTPHPPVPTAITASSSILAQGVIFLQNHMQWLVICWIAGLFLFSLKVTSGYWYTTRLKQATLPVDAQWNEKLAALAQRLGIRRMIRLAQTEKVTAPVVIGYLKPVVLVPLGMLSGLSSTEVETILLHELTHIRRHDYLINFAQIVIETLYFFNPFVWMLSTIIRQERECCCDDEVLAHLPSARTYAVALTKLEEVRLHGHSFALAATNNKYHLLSRIKRFMEPEKKQTPRERLLPFALIALLLICASWVAVKPSAATYPMQNKPQQPNTTDTARQTKKPQVTTYSRQTIITVGQDGKPHKEVIESFNGDETFKDVIKSRIPETVEPPLPPAPRYGMTGVIAFVPDAPNPPMHYPFFKSMTDTVPKNDTWEKFNKEFQEMFKENFGDFYMEHQQQLEDMMKELNDKFPQQSQSFHFNTTNDLQEVMANAQFEIQRAIEEQHRVLNGQQQTIEKARQKSDSIMATVEVQRARAEANRVKAEHLFEIQTQKNIEKNNKALLDMLIKDKYLDANEKIRDLEIISGDPLIKINGKEIKLKEKHKEKYNVLIREMF